MSQYRYKISKNTKLNSMVTALDKNTALVLIDLQKGVTGLPLAMPVSGILANSAKLVAAFRRKSLPIVIVNVNPKGFKSLNTRKEQGISQNRPFTEESLLIVPEIITDEKDIFITKKSWGAFYETTLDEELKKRAITGIVLAGISTSIGVEGTARGASERGYNITFARDAMTDLFAEAHENSMKYIFPRIGEIDDTDRIIEVLG
jgi:nicotinamidase-related amidase